ncbi:hypothetical protein FVE85_7499 [Porphyridium purpureum]|uniref:Uncharacterized protein n=1 Tax=Porphyridium purpureum TaxID=35688 RepID=A0A5J4ZA79_PORPP|nr:hypothetical protein FVE85_7499 [Porphyridium purpureum]|eukprot:POR1734..scf295_1
MVGRNVTLAQALRRAPQEMIAAPHDRERWFVQSAWHADLFGKPHENGEVKQAKSPMLPGCGKEAGEDPLGLHAFLAALRVEQLRAHDDDVCSDVSSTTSGKDLGWNDAKPHTEPREWDEREFERLYHARSAFTRQANLAIPHDPDSDGVRASAEEQVDKSWPELPAEQVQVVDMQVSADEELMGPDDESTVQEDSVQTRDLSSPGTMCAVVCEAAQGQRRSISRRSSLTHPAESRARLSAKFVAMGVQVTDWVTSTIPTTKSVGVQVDRMDLLLGSRVDARSDTGGEHAVSALTVDVGVQIDDSSGDEYVHMDYQGTEYGNDCAVDSEGEDLKHHDFEHGDEVDTRELSYDLRLRVADDMRVPVPAATALPEEDILEEEQEEGASAIKRSLLFDDEQGRVTTQTVRDPAAAKKHGGSAQNAAPLRERLKKAASKAPSRGISKPREEAKRFVHLKPREAGVTVIDATTGCARETSPTHGSHANVRRSSRIRFPVLKFWKNERVVYERRQSMDMPVISEIIELENDSSPEAERYVGRAQYHRRGTAAMRERASPRLSNRKRRPANMDEASSDVDEDSPGFDSQRIQSSAAGATRTQPGSGKSKREVQPKKRRLVSDKSNRVNNTSSSKKRRRRTSTDSEPCIEATPLSKQMALLLASPTAAETSSPESEARYMARFQ